jgi:EAL domain-containing protein (putative c-di-GMP-specific phosphodiesterase class I)
MRRALAEDRFTLFAQPIIDLRDDRNVQFELLLRMVGERGGLVAPGLFLPVAERHGLIPEIDRWVLGEAAFFAAAGHSVQVNVSAASLADPGMADHVEWSLAAAGAPASRLVLEITETAAMADEHLAASFVKRVRALGCRVALDDFGTGFGSLRYLKRFRVDMLKIDREFVTDLLQDPASEHVVRAVVQLATNFGVETVGEGVEDAATLARLRALGVDRAQGFHLASPAPALDVLAGGPVLALA